LRNDTPSETPSPSRQRFGRLAPQQALQLGPDELALRESRLELGLDLAALHGVDGVPQLGAQFLDLLIDQHWSLMLVKDDTGGHGGPAWHPRTN
jgi:hypothetical protein